MELIVIPRERLYSENVDSAKFAQTFDEIINALRPGGRLAIIETLPVDGSPQPFRLTPQHAQALAARGRLDVLRWQARSFSGFPHPLPVAVLRKPRPERALNLALGKPCSQSSLSQWSHAPDEAGNLTCGYRRQSYAMHTATEAAPWARIDLCQPTQIGCIAVFNRDTGSGKAATLDIWLSEDGERYSRCHSHAGQRPFGGQWDRSPLVVPLDPPARARYVKLQIRDNALHLDQVEIYARAEDMTL